METVQAQTTGQKIAQRRGTRGYRQLAAELTAYGRSHAILIEGQWRPVLGPNTEVSHGSIIRWEKDQTMPIAESLFLLAGVFGCTVDDLLPEIRTVCCNRKRCRKCKGTGGTQ